MNWKGWATGAALMALLVFMLALVVRQADAQVPTITVSWTAPGDDGNVGAASMFEMRRATVAIGADTLAWWNAATAVTGLPVPAVAGTTQSVVVSTGLSWGTTYYFLMRARDDGPNPNLPPPGFNWSGWSNTATKTLGPPPDVVAPNRITDLLAQ